MPGLAQEAKWNDLQEYQDFDAVYKEMDNVEKAALADRFLADHKNADPLYRTQAFQMMFRSYTNVSNWEKIAEAYERMSVAPRLPDTEKKTYTQVALVAYTNLKNNPRALELAEEILKDDANNLTALVSLSNLLFQTLPATEPDKSLALARTLEITKRGLEQQRPDNMPDTLWNSIQLQLRQTSCMVLLNQQKYTESIAECRNALKINNKDSYSWYLIGMALKVDLVDKFANYKKSVDTFNDVRLTADQIQLDELRGTTQIMLQLTQNKKTEALDAFASAAASGGTVATLARDEILNITKDPAETNRLIEEKKSQFGNNQR